MAKRRRLTAPAASEIEEIEEGFATKPAVSPFGNGDAVPAGGGAVPPIAKVSAETAQARAMEAVADRVALAKDRADAQAWRDADGAGLVARPIALAEIDRSYLRRDRLSLDEEEMAELIGSLRQHGLRSPVEVVALEEGYGLVSGFRRLEAFARLAPSDPRFAQIPAFVRSPGEAAAPYVAMVEENELRSNLSPYERGRIAVLVAGQGVFASVGEAVDSLFAAASKAKRSKVRSFAAVHEALGDLLQFPEALPEKAGLKLAAAVRAGAQAGLRAALAAGDAQTAQEEWQCLERALARVDAAPAGQSDRGGRPRQVARLDGGQVASGGQLSAEVGPSVTRIELKDRGLSQAEAETLMALIRDHLG